MICEVYVSSLITTGVLILIVTGQTDLCRFGDTNAGCVFPCLCTSGCDRKTGACLYQGVCQMDDPSAAGIRRTGTGCRIGNVARGKPAFQGGKYLNLHAGLAVDGIIGSAERYCAHPVAGGGNKAWWYVDLQDAYTVVSVTIFNRKNDYAHKRTGNFRLGVGDTTDGDQTRLCKDYTRIVPDGGHDTIMCDSRVTGRYVTINRKGGIQPEFLGLCEVMVHGYKPIDCDNHQCHSCNHLTGCSRCTEGYKYPDCKTECGDKQYGDNCGGQCSANCVSVPGSRSCSISDGRCVNGCLEPFYGDQCQDSCNSGCRVVTGSNTCHRETGDCNNDCNNGFYGTKCESPCSSQCASVNGKPVCAKTNGMCYTGCQEGWFGDFCNQRCSTHCKALPENGFGSCNQLNGSCIQGCVNGYFADDCNKACSMKCFANEGTPTCERYSGLCTLCPYGYYGETCEYSCSGRCETLLNTKTCDRYSGVCSHGCKLIPYDTWYAGRHCNVSISYVDFPKSNNVYVTNVTNASITVEWSHIEGMPLNSTAVYGYRITIFEDTRLENTSYQRPISEHTVFTKYSQRLPGLLANTTYQILVNVYRHLPGGKIEDSQNANSVSGTTLADLGRVVSQEPTKGPSGQFGLAAPVAGSVAGFLIIAALVAILIVVLIRKRRMKPRDNDNLQIEEIPQSSTIKETIKPKKTTIKKEIDNPSFDGHCDEDASEKVYYGFPATKSLDEGTCVQVEDLEVYIGAKRYTQDGLKKEYNDIPQDELASCNVARQKENIIKNRFKNIKAYDISRVVLEPDEEDASSDYINANFIKGYPNKEKHYVATQGPKPETICDLWLMIWHLKSNRIVMVTRVKELNKTKCEQYWPEAVGEVKTCGGITVTTTGCDSYCDYNLTIITLQKGGEKRTVKHLQFLSWPDKEAPERAFPLLAFRKKLRSFDKDGTGPIVIHCSAGVGRSGTLIALDYLLDQMKKEGKVDVPKLVTQLRKQRMNMVQTLAQYVFLYEALLEAYQQGETAIPGNVYQQRYQQLVAGNEYSNEVPIEEQFTILCKMKQHKSPDDKLHALSKENSRRNRNPDIIPDNIHRLFLSTKCPGTNDYINAVAVNSFLEGKIFIVTQLPLPDTVVDFWRLVYEQKCHTVLTVETPDINEKDCPRYWSLEKNEVIKFGNLEVRMDMTEDDEKGFTEERRLTLSYSSAVKDNTVSVRHILFKRWSRNQSVPRKEDTLNLLERLQKWQQQREDGKIIIQCKDGAQRSGLICAAHYMLEKIKADSEVDVFLAVRAVALHRQQFVNNLDQYCFLHEVAMEYIAKNEPYGNFK